MLGQQVVGGGGGITPYNLFRERSNDSSLLRFPKDDGIWPVRALCDMLRT